MSSTSPSHGRSLDPDRLPQSEGRRRPVGFPLPAPGSSPAWPSARSRAPDACQRHYSPTTPHPPARSQPNERSEGRLPYATPPFPRADRTREGKQPSGPGCWPCCRRRLERLGPREGRRLRSEGRAGSHAACLPASRGDDLSQTVAERLFQNSFLCLAALTHRSPFQRQTTAKDTPLSCVRLPLAAASKH
jgi:hypothetical protein